MLAMAKTKAKAKPKTAYKKGKKGGK
jgi:hypothetical protein